MKEPFYKSKKWEKKRKKILKRDSYMCQQCARYGRRMPASVVHHIKCYEEFPELALTDSNLISLCDKCHNKQHPEKAKKSRAAISPPFYF